MKYDCLLSEPASGLGQQSAVSLCQNVKCETILRGKDQGEGSLDVLPLCNHTLLGSDDIAKQERKKNLLAGIKCKYLQCCCAVSMTELISCYLVLLVFFLLIESTCDVFNWEWHMWQRLQEVANFAWKKRVRNLKKITKLLCLFFQRDNNKKNTCHLISPKHSKITVLSCLTLA